MITKECMKSIQKLEPLESEYNIKLNKLFLYKIATNVSARRCYNFDLDNNEAKKSTFLVSVEEKLPQETFLKWKDHNSKLKVEY